MIRIRYNWPISRLPSVPVYESQFFTHSLSCKKGGFVTIHHNKIHDLTYVALAEEVCPDVRRKLRMVELEGEKLTLRTTNRSSKAGLDISPTSF